MATITLDQARPGLVLSADVLDRRGHLLVPTGNELSERHLAALRMWGVLQVDVEGDAPVEDVGVPMDPAIEAQAGAETADLFRNAGDPHLFLDALKDISRRRRARELAQGVRA